VLNAGGNVTITAASSTLLTDNNSFSGATNFSNNVILNGSSALFNSSLTVYQNGSNRAFAVRSNFPETDFIDQPILFSLASNDTSNPFELDVDQIGAGSLANRGFLFQTSQSGIASGGN